MLILLLNFCVDFHEPGNLNAVQSNYTDYHNQFDENYQIQQYHEEIRNHYAQQSGGPLTSSQQSLQQSSSQQSSTSTCKYSNQFADNPSQYPGSVVQPIFGNQPSMEAISGISSGSLNLQPGTSSLCGSQKVGEQMTDRRNVISGGDLNKSQDLVCCPGGNRGNCPCSLNSLQCSPKLDHTGQIQYNLSSSNLSNIQSIQSSSNLSNIQSIQSSSNLSNIQSIQPSSNISNIQSVQSSSNLSNIQSMQSSSNLSNIQTIQSSNNQQYSSNSSQYTSIVNQQNFSNSSSNMQHSHSSSSFQTSSSMSESSVTNTESAVNWQYSPLLQTAPDVPQANSTMHSVLSSSSLCSSSSCVTSTGNGKIWL